MPRPCYLRSNHATLFILTRSGGSHKSTASGNYVNLLLLLLFPRIDRGRGHHFMIYAGRFVLRNEHKLIKAATAAAAGEAAQPTRFDSIFMDSVSDRSACARLFSLANTSLT